MIIQDVESENDGFVDKLLKTALSIPLMISWSAAFMYSILLAVTFVFLMMYIKRMIMVCFLVIIAPLAALSYSIDKMVNGRSGILNQWLKEFFFNVFIQSLHCIVYLVFVGTAMNLVYNYTNLNGQFGPSISNFIYAIVCICCIFVGDKIIRTIFGFNKSSSLTKKMFVGSMIMTAAKDITKIKQAKEASKGESKTSAPALMPNGESSERIMNGKLKTPATTENEAMHGTGANESQGSNEGNKRKPRSAEQANGGAQTRGAGGTNARGKNNAKLKNAMRIISDHTPSITAQNFGRGYANIVKNATLINPVQSRIKKTKEKRKPSIQEQFLMASRIYAQQHGLSERELDLKIQALRKTNISDIRDNPSDIIYRNWIDAMDKDLEKNGEKRPDIAMRDYIRENL